MTKKLKDRIINILSEIVIYTTTAVLILVALDINTIYGYSVLRMLAVLDIIAILILATADVFYIDREEEEELEKYNKEVESIIEWIENMLWKNDRIIDYSITTNNYSLITRKEITVVIYPTTDIKDVEIYFGNNANDIITKLDKKYFPEASIES